MQIFHEQKLQELFIEPSLVETIKIKSPKGDFIFRGNFKNY